MSSMSQPPQLPIAEWTPLSQTSRAIPWQDDYEIGLGINHLTGLAAANPFVQIDRPVPPPGSGELKLDVVQDTNLESKFRELSAGASVDFAFGPGVPSFGAGFKAAFGKQFAKASSRTVYLIYAHWESQTEMKDEDFQLSDEARQLARDDPWAFRAKYGDYFIAGATYAVKYAAFVVHTEEDKLKRKNFDLHMNVGVEHFGTEAARTLDKQNVQMKYQVSIKAQNLGRFKDEARPPVRNYKNPPTLAAAANFAEWYIDPSNVEGVEIIAHLRPYSRLTGVNLPFAVPVLRGTLDELDDLRDKLRELHDLANLVPTFDQMATPIWDLMSKKRTLFRLVEDKRVFIAHDQGLRSNFTMLARSHIEEFREFRRICAFWQLVNDSKADEPTDGPVGYRNERAGGSLLFGCMHGTDDVKVVEWEKRQVRIDDSTSEEVLLADLKVPQGTHIVGWSVSADKRDGVWKQHSPHIIFSTLPQIKFYRVKKQRWTLPWRNEHCTYTVHFYAVQDNKYFSALCETIRVDGSRTLITRPRPPPEDME